MNKGVQTFRNIFEYQYHLLFPLQQQKSQNLFSYFAILLEYITYISAYDSMKNNYLVDNRPSGTLLGSSLVLQISQPPNESFGDYIQSKYIPASSAIPVSYDLMVRRRMAPQTTVGRTASGNGSMIFQLALLQKRLLLFSVRRHTLAIQVEATLLLTRDQFFNGKLRDTSRCHGSRLFLRSKKKDLCVPWKYECKNIISTLWVVFHRLGP